MGNEWSMQMLFTAMREAIVTSAYVSPYLSLAARIGEREDMLAWLELAMTYGGEWTKGPATWALSLCAGDPEFIAIVEAQ